MNLFDILSYDERIIVASDTSERMIFTWNQSCTLQAWYYDEGWSQNTASAESGEWIEYGIRTLSQEPITFKQARTKAIEWQADGVRDDR